MGGGTVVSAVILHPNQWLMAGIYLVVAALTTFLAVRRIARQTLPRAACQEVQSVLVPVVLPMISNGQAATLINSGGVVIPRAARILESKVGPFHVRLTSYFVDSPGPAPIYWSGP